MRKLHVFPAVKHVLLSTINHFGFAFHISWPWMLALLPLNVAVNLYMVSVTLAGAPAYDPYLISLSLMLLVASTVAFSSIAVSWHRYILVDEIPHGWKRLRVDGIVWRYVGNTLLIILIMFGIGFVGGFLLAIIAGILTATLSQNFGFLVVVPIAAAGVAFGITSTFRLMTKLPAVALGRRDYTLGYAWRDTAGNFWPILGYALLIFIVLAVIGGLVSALAIPLSELGFAGISVSLLFQLAVNWFGTIVGVTMLTSLYGIFYEGRAV